MDSHIRQVLLCHFVLHDGSFIHVDDFVLISRQSMILGQLLTKISHRWRMNLFQKRFCFKLIPYKKILLDKKQIWSNISWCPGAIMAGSHFCKARQGKQSVRGVRVLENVWNIRVFEGQYDNRHNLKDGAWKLWQGQKALIRFWKCGCSLKHLQA